MNRITINSPQIQRTYTIPDPGCNANFVMTEGNQTINGSLYLTNTSNQLILGTGGTVTINPPSTNDTKKSPIPKTYPIQWPPLVDARISEMQDHVINIYKILAQMTIEKTGHHVAKYKVQQHAGILEKYFKHRLSSFRFSYEYECKALIIQTQGKHNIDFEQLTEESIRTSVRKELFDKHIGQFQFQFCGFESHLMIECYVSNNDREAVEFLKMLVNVAKWPLIIHEMSWHDWNPFYILFDSSFNFTQFPFDIQFPIHWMPSIYESICEKIHVKELAVICMQYVNECK